MQIAGTGEYTAYTAGQFIHFEKQTGSNLSSAEYITLYAELAKAQHEQILKLSRSTPLEPIDNSTPTDNNNNTTK